MKKNTTKKNNRQKINCLYSHFKDSEKKLKIVCDWDEVIQSHEPYALWKINIGGIDFPEYFPCFWKDNKHCQVNYSPYGSSLTPINDVNKWLEKQKTFKDSPDFYQQAPFLTIAKELLKLIKENKVEKVIFLSAYDKRIFPNQDPRKHQIFKETFGKFPNCSLNLIGFDSEKQGQDKVEWIQKNHPDLDVLIDDNPIICGNAECAGEFWKNTLTVIAPYYPDIEKEHHKDILLVKTSVSDLKKDNF